MVWYHPCLYLKPLTVGGIVTSKRIEDYYHRQPTVPARVTA
jgi:hypothetical protein